MNNLVRLIRVSSNFERTEGLWNNMYISLHENIFEPLAHRQILLAHCIVY